MRVLKSLNDFLLNATDAKSFVVTAADVEVMQPNNVAEFNAILKAVQAGNNFEAEQVDGGWRFTKIVAREANVYEGGKADARVGDAMPDNPFRPRYRKLTDPELAHHDAIKTQASILLDLIKQTPGIRDGQPYDNPNSIEELYNNIERSRVHLEDAVYRAVKALTA